MAVRLVVFDALHTLLAPRLPIPVQYAQTFAPYLGALDPDALKRAFKTGTCVRSLAARSLADIDGDDDSARGAPGGEARLPERRAGLVGRGHPAHRRWRGRGPRA